ncbi:MAG: DEAD/DEAH box helicase family protein [Saccharofermentanales bacterium]
MQERVFLGRNSDFISALDLDIRHACSIKIIVSFIRESGVRALSNALNEAAMRGTKIQILTGIYLQVTEPSALYLLKELLKNRAQIRLYDKPDQSFHPKGYLIETAKEKHIYIGSSNISNSGLQHGLEWNYRVDQIVDELAVAHFESAFDNLFTNESFAETDEFLKYYAQNWKMNAVNTPGIVSKVDYDDYTGKKYKFNDEYDGFKSSKLSLVIPAPRGAQIEALYELDIARQQGVEKALLVAATGIGKTYISAFDVMRFGAKRVLFIAHRDEILTQAMGTFSNVNSKAKCKLFNSENKSIEADYVFASIQTIGKTKFLAESFLPKNYFDYIIIDEFHHAAANSYKAIIEYFTPLFLLGLTATPYRMDNKDLFSLCNDNIVYELDLISAINRGILCPYQYYAVYDVVDYNNIGFVNGKYRVDELEKEYKLGYRQQLVLEKYKQFGGKRTIGFCASINHADDMTEYFIKNKIKAVAIHSGQLFNESASSRKKIIELFKKGEIQVIFVVDIFNEGVDIPEIDTVMFLRPTESYVIFLQQLGRGLRKDSTKKCLKVIDFIGNYKKAHYKPFLLSGINPMSRKEHASRNYFQIQYPEGCSVQFDLRIIDMFEEMSKNDPLKFRMRDEFIRLSNELSRRPMRNDIMMGSDISIKEFIRTGYLQFLKNMDMLTSEEKSWIDTIIEKFLIRIEKTSMTRSYKLPVLLALIENNGFVDYDILGNAFRDFYMLNPQRMKDLLTKSQSTSTYENPPAYKNIEDWSNKDFLNLALKNPVFFLAKTESDFIKHDEVGKHIYFADEIRDVWSDGLKMHLLDIVKVRETQYYARKYLITKKEKEVEKVKTGEA